MRKAGNVGVLMQEDIDYMLDGGTVTVPEGVLRLMLHADVVERWKECDEETDL